VQTGRSRGFGFCYFRKTSDAEKAREAMNGMELQGRKIRVDFSVTRRAHTPTPGRYMGRPDDRPYAFFSIRLVWMHGVFCFVCPKVTSVQCQQWLVVGCFIAWS
jgi:RNA recognition motif-containing protein